MIETSVRIGIARLGPLVLDVRGALGDPRNSVVARGLCLDEISGPSGVDELGGAHVTGTVVVKTLAGPPIDPRLVPGGSIKALYDADHGLAGWWDRERCVGEWSVRTPGIPSWDVGAPMRPVIAWALEESGCVLVHGAGIVGRDGVILIAGRGGAGKSTTAMHAVASGYGCLGDDYCLVDPRAAVAHRVYGTAKVHDTEYPALAHRLGTLGAAFGRCEPPDHRTIVRLPNSIMSGQIVGVAVPVRTPSLAGSLVPCSGSVLLREIAPVSILQLDVDGRVALPLIAELLRSVKTYELHLGVDRASNVEALGSLIGAPLFEPFLPV